MTVTCPRGHACFLWTCTEERLCDMHDDPAFTAGCRWTLIAGDQGLKCNGCDFDFCLPCSIAMRGTAFENRDRFSGRTWRVPSAELLAQVDAAFRLINDAAARLRLPRGYPLALELPSTTSGYPRVSLLPAQLQRAAIGFAAAVSLRLVTAPASVDVSARTWQWRTCVLLRVMGGYVAKNQGTVADCRAAAATRVAGKPGIIEAAESGDIELVRDRITAYPAYVHKRDPVSKKTILEWCSLKGYTYFCRLLVAAGADVNVKLIMSMTLLHYSSTFGHFSLCRLLVALGADVNAKDNSMSVSPLHESCGHGHLGICRLLVASRADVNAQCSWLGRSVTPLHKSSKEGHLNVCRFLVESKADVAVRDSDGHTPLENAVMNGHMDVVAYLRRIGSPPLSIRLRVCVCLGACFQ